VIDKINGEMWDLERNIEEDYKIKLMKLDDDEGKKVLWN
jgi:uncharacterized protein YlaN (UPF0358 family)